MLKIIKDFDYDEICERISQSSLKTGVYVGCDAKTYRDITRFNTVIVLHFDCKHGATLYHQASKVDRALSLHEKLWKEIELSAKAAEKVAEAVGDIRPFKVHLDLNLNPKYRSSTVTKAAVAYIKAMGFTPVVKPDAYVATHVADHLVNGRNFKYPA